MQINVLEDRVLIKSYFELNYLERFWIILLCTVVTSVVHFIVLSKDLASPGLYAVPLVLIALGFPWKWGWVSVPLFLGLSLYRDMMLFYEQVLISRYSIIAFLFIIIFIIGTQLRNYYAELKDKKQTLKTQRDELRHVYN